MEFQEALMKLVVHKSPTHHRDFFHSIPGKETEKVASTKPKWKILFRRSSSASVSRTCQQSHHRVQPKLIPEEFSCPVSGSLMPDPVIVSSGHTLERVCVEACKNMDFTPTLNDGSVPGFSTAIPNLALKSTIDNWCQNRSLNPPKPLEFSRAQELVRTLSSRNPKTHIGEEEKRISVTERNLIQGVKDVPSVKLDHAVTELTRSSSDESVAAAAFRTPINVVTPPLQLTDRPSCYSSASSSSEIETLTTRNINEEEESFLTKLKSSQAFDIQGALIELRKIRTQESSRAVLCTPLLVNLSLEKINKVKIVRSGLVPVFINVLKSGSREAQEHACGALFSLAFDDHNKTAIGALGALQPLMHMLRSGTERTRYDSALALYHLSLVQSNRSKLVKNGSVPVLLSIVKSGHMMDRVFLILCNLTSGSDGRAAMLDSGAVECLMSLLRRNELDDSTREGCVAVCMDRVRRVEVKGAGEGGRCGGGVGKGGEDDEWADKVESEEDVGDVETGERGGTRGSGLGSVA
ncbi:U-box domain-containing protein 40 [Hibiscus syriacus]|uniref:RING-type E3 ubiquitin transferase n=1 Tax=Hibiscus syriacus TaxID=106335 RepID=A0A6A2X070_HIBSY|nr:U-box domain-containing protein 40 [Hibiscus syriacus]